ERMGGKPDAKAIIFYTEDGPNKVIDEIQVTNTGNEVLYIQRISVRIEGEELADSKKNIFNIFPPDNPIITNLDYNKIEPGSISRPISFSPIEIGINQVGKIVIGLVTESKRFGSIEHHLSKISDE
ncbi:MAG: hypothetical protein GQ562_00310, partial [Anaerolineales bacterium]|nr:hypothetical protein [Anaerolineales bacterium]